MDRCDVSVSAVARPVIEEMKRLAQSSAPSIEALLYGVVLAGIQHVVADPARAMEPRYGLKNEAFVNVRRFAPSKKSKHRVFFLCSPELRRSVVLWVGYRGTRGGEDDCYEQMKTMLARGDFDADFSFVGLLR